MSLRLILGRAGTGKTQWCLEHIIERLRDDPLGPVIYWILPKQATFIAERRLTCESGLSGFSRVRIVSFEWLGQDILECTHGAAIPLISAGGRQMILGHLLREHADQLKYFRASARQAGLSAELGSAFAELERRGLLPEDLLQSLASAKDADEAFINKLHDLALLYQAQRDFLGQERIDPHRRNQLILDQVAHCPFLGEARVFVDGFFDFSDHERKLVLALSHTCSQVNVTMLLDPESAAVRFPDRKPGEMSLFRRSEEQYQRLMHDAHRAGVAIDEPVVLKHAHRFKNPALLHLERSMFARPPSPLAEAGDISLIEAHNRRAEVDAAARTIRAWLAEGMRLRDIAVLMRDVDDYHDLIAASFAEHRIPFFADRRRSAAHHPLPQLVRSMVEAAVRNYPREAMLSLIKTGLCGLHSDEADALENFVLEHNVRGGIWGSDTKWEDHLRLAEDEEDLPPDPGKIDIETLRRRVVDPIRPLRELLRGSPSVRELAGEVYRVLEKMGAQRVMSRWIEAAEQSQDIEQAAEHEQVWNTLTALLDQLVDLLGDNPVSGEDFLTIIESGLEGFDLALAPPTLDQVLVGDVDRTRTPAVRGVVLLGLNEGEFPRRPSERSAFSDRERHWLENRGIQLDPPADRKLLDERFLGYVAFSCAAERLCVLRATAGEDGAQQQPSFFWQRLRETFPLLEPVVLNPQNADSIELLGTRSQALSWLMSQVRSAKMPAALQPDAAGYYQSLTGAQRDELTQRIWSALAYRNRPRINPALASALFAPPLRASVTRMETFASCPFKHFLRYGLELYPRDESEMNPLRMGTIYHGVLERYVRRMLAEKMDWLSLVRDGDATLLAALTDEVAAKVCDAILFQDLRSKHLFGIVRQTVARVIGAQVEAARVGEVKPLAVETSFGFKHSKLPALELKTPGGRTVLLEGKIDRIDLVGDDALAVIDYKTSEKRLGLGEVHHRLALQLLTYLVVAREYSNKLSVDGKQLKAAAALYVQLSRRIEREEHPDDACDPESADALLAVRPRGLVSTEFLSRLDKEGKVVCGRIKNDGEPQLGSGDLATNHQMEALLARVREMLAEIGDQIMTGAIDAAPYMLGQVTPCPNCDYRAVCRFDLRTGNRYVTLTVLNRQAVLEALIPPGGKGGSRG